MKQSKFLVMAFTFLILIAITPFIFSKLMNAKFNQMLDKYRKEGYKIELKKDKSSYITTDKVFYVVAPIDSNIKKVAGEVEVKFKNLPVTNVDFYWKIDKVVFQNNQTLELNGKVKGIVVTPNFKEFSYKVDDIYDTTQNVILKISGIKGTFNKDFSSVTFKAKDFSIKDINNNVLELRDLSVGSYKDSVSLSSKIKANVIYSNDNTSAQIKGVVLDARVFGGKSINVAVGGEFDKFIVPNILEIDNFNLKLNLKNIKTTLEELKKIETLPPQEQQTFFVKTLQKGFGVSLRSDLSNVKSLVNGDNLGGFNINFDAKIDKFSDNENQAKAVNATLNVVVSKKIVEFMKNMAPGVAARFLMLAKDNGKDYVLKLRIEKGKLIVDE